MKPAEFFKLCEGYYNKPYTDIQKGIIADYLSRRSETFADRAFHVLVEKFSYRFGVPPGVAEIEEYTTEIYARMTEAKAPSPLDTLSPEEVAENREVIAGMLSGLSRKLRMKDAG